MADLTLVDPAAVGLSADRLARIDAHFARYVDDGRLAVEDGLLSAQSAPALAAARDALAELETFDAAGVEAALRGALVDGLGLKPRLAFGPVRAAVTGRKISPPLFESIELLGRDSTLARLDAAQQLVPHDAAR